MDAPDSTGSNVVALRHALDDLDAWVQDYHRRESGSVPRRRAATNGSCTTRELLGVRNACVLAERAEGKTYNQIGATLCISAARVGQIVRRARAKAAAGATAREEAARLEEHRTHMDTQRRRVEIEYHLQEAYLWLCRSYGRDVWRDNRDI